MIYDKDGSQLVSAYDVNGDALAQAYDIDGNELIEPPTPPIGTNLTVCSYNIGQWYNGSGANVPSAKYETYYTLQRATLSAIGADIIAFQEYWEPFSSGHAVADVIGEFFTSSYRYTGGGTYVKKAIYANGYTVSNGTYTTFTAGTEGYQKATVEVDGKQIWIINAHLATSSNESRKVAEAQQLAGIVSNMERFIIFGDFNTVCKSVNDTEYTTIMKQFVDAGYNVANCSGQFGFKDTWFGADSSQYPCDHIITSANIHINSVAVNNQKFLTPTGDTIDHIPLIAEVTIS